MPDYKDLFYKSQAQLADAIQMIDALKLKLVFFAQYCEQMVMEADDENSDDEE